MEKIIYVPPEKWKTYQSSSYKYEKLDLQYSSGNKENITTLEERSCLEKSIYYTSWTLEKLMIKNILPTLPQGNRDKRLHC